MFWVSQGFYRSDRLRKTCRVSVLSACWIQFVFIGKVFIRFRIDFQVKVWFFAKSIFHFIGNLLGKCLVRPSFFWSLLKFLLWVKSYQDGFGNCFQSIRSAFRACAQHSVHPTGGSLRVFRHFAWLEVGSVKVALSRPAHQRVTHTVGQLDTDYQTFCGEMPI